MPPRSRGPPGSGTSSGTDRSIGRRPWAGERRLQLACMHSSIRFTTRTSDDGPALIRMRTVESLAVISVVMSAEYQTYGATLLTRSIGDEPVPAKVCQLKLPLVVVLKLRPRIESVADVMVETPAV